MVCAAALEVQRIVIEENLLANVKQMGIYLERALRQTFKNHPHVGDIRGRGLFWAVSARSIPLLHYAKLYKLELVNDRESKEPFPSSLGLAMAIHETALSQEPGMMIYPGTGSAGGWQGDHVILAPAYNITESEIDIMVRAMAAAVDTVLRRVVKGRKYKL